MTYDGSAASVNCDIQEAQRAVLCVLCWINKNSERGRMQAVTTGQAALHRNARGYLSSGRVTL